MIKNKQFTEIKQECLECCGGPKCATIRYCWENLKDDVNTWARANVPEEYHYSSPATYWYSALSEGIITRHQYNFAQDRFGDFWDYTGD